MGRALIPDTNVLIDVERGGLSLDDVLSRDDRILLPTVVISEFELGVETADTSRTAATRRAILDVFIQSAADVLEFTRATAHHYAVLASHTIRAGVPRSQFDLVIAAHGLETGAPILSSDFQARFADLPGVHSAW